MTCDRKHAYAWNRLAIAFPRGATGQSKGRPCRMIPPQISFSRVEKELHVEGQVALVNRIDQRHRGWDREGAGQAWARPGVNGFGDAGEIEGAPRRNQRHDQGVRVVSDAREM